MNTLTRFTVAALLAAPAWASEPVSKMPEHIGFGSGALLGAAIAGPVGVVVGGALGTLIGHDMVSDQVMAEKERALAHLHQEIQHASRTAAELNALNASAEAELMAFRELLSELSLSVHFETDSAMTAGRYRQALEALAVASQRIEGMTVELVGHADPRGSEAHNWALSQARADSVGSVLRDAGAPAAALSPIARGETEALVDGASGGYALDRRVDLNMHFEEESPDASLYTLRP